MAIADVIANATSVAFRAVGEDAIYTPSLGSPISTFAVPVVAPAEFGKPVAAAETRTVMAIPVADVAEPKRGEQFTVNPTKPSAKTYAVEHVIETVEGLHRIRVRRV